MNDYISLTDLELTGLLKSGDRASFTEIYNRYWSVMYVHALKMLQDEDEAKDLVQDLFISLWTKASDLELKTNLSGYLYIMVRHKVLNYIRQKKTSDRFIDALALQLGQNAITIVDDINEKELAAAIEREIESLPPKMKQIFDMSRKQYLSHKEIAIELDISDKTVKKQIGNAIKVIKTKLYKAPVIIFIFFYYLLSR